jgi:hypothetical protein
MSNLQHAIWTLRKFNLWRRSDEDMDQPDPWEIGKAIDDAIEAMEELSEWKTLSGWGGTPEIINDFIKGQQSRIYAAQDAEEQRDRLAEALQRVRDGYGGQLASPNCCEDCDFLIPIDKALQSLTTNEL